MNVLIIEDHPKDRKLINVVLQRDGHVVHERTSAEGALDAVLEYSPDVILLDLRLPGTDGLTLVHQLKTNDETREVPIVAMTSYPASYSREELLAAGCDAFLIKPLDTRELTKQLAEVAKKAD